MNKDKVKQTSTELTVGIFVFAILGALIFFTIILSYDNIFSKNYRLKVLFDNVTGLTRGDKVFVQGVDVGRVREMTILHEGVMVELTMKYAVKLKQDYVIQVKPSSVLGGKYIEIYEGTRDAPPVDPNEQVIGRAPVDFIAETAKVVQDIRASLDEGGVLDNISATMANVKEITDKIVKGEGTLGRMINDETVFNDLKEVSADLRSVSDRLEKGEGTLGKLLSSDETIYNDLRATLDSINAAMAKVKDGEGTLGKIVNDDRLYDEILKALAEVRAMIDDIRETSPVTSLTSVFFGAF
jgi:phospholipid/cholesterol/gamma-HCH transport system substrate-binding protein